jgi:hypothetical protein
MPQPMEPILPHMWASEPETTKNERETKTRTAAKTVFISRPPFLFFETRIPENLDHS